MPVFCAALTPRPHGAVSTGLRAKELKMIKPSIGRVVWFQPEHAHGAPERDQPHAALIVYVWGDRMVNLVVFNQNGMLFAAYSVTLLQDGDPIPPHDRYAQWMPSVQRTPCRRR